MHNLLPEAVKLGSMQKWICHVISDHLICWTISDFNVAFGLLVSDVEVSDVQVMRALEQHGAFVVLIENIFLDRKLSLKKKSCPYHWEKISSVATPSASV